MSNCVLSGDNLTLKMITDFLRSKCEVSIEENAAKRVKAARKTVLEMINKGKVVYGINTGFGKLSQVKIPLNELESLQLNLLRSHACGVSDPVDTDIVVLMMFLKINNLSAGYSGCSLEVINKLIELLNKKIYPIVPRRGSVGASGDLAPLAHMSLPLIDEGEVLYKNKRYKSEDLVKQGIYEPIKLGPKDGLSLINGTQYSTALLTSALIQAKDLVLLSELAASMSIEAVLSTDVPFRKEIQEIRRQKGQKVVAKHVRNFLKNSEIVESHKNCEKVQDPYSFRCVPQVLGAVRDSINFVQEIVENEFNAVTDNPLVFSDSGEILSGGNFHAEPLAMASDQLSIALTELGNISERRIANLTDQSVSGLPAFLIKSSGINSGFMIAHVAAASLASENRTLSNPASVGNIPTSANQEDHVSMAPAAGLKLLQIVENVKVIIWIEMLAAAQGMDFRRPLKAGIGSELGYKKVRSLVKYLDKDRIMYVDLRQYKKLLSDYTFIREINDIAESN
ncbi:MAG: histidine ammonia-lyase [Candidatus Marinimicrobia bacterium]|nr:histidine ammonia-lyase [Candidatus Neomarinimicrobiota bacterium]MCK4448484.1 histidine ammonia-lyase [Candidatus Neomarinimicrobiota bacterium]